MTPEQTDDNTVPFVDRGNLFPARAGPFAAGKLILGRFKIVRRVGSGGMGDVYDAMDLELGQVALKTIRADIAGNPELLSRFKREVQLARKVSGPHVCRIHELFVATGAQPAFLTMEFLAGVTLAEKMVGSGPIPWREAHTIALEICSGLRAIHEAGIIHRDLKCGNIMLANRNGRTCAVLMDFGLASEVDHRKDVSGSGLTWTGAVVGTPDYMAPEQFEGGTLTPATDIYAVGVVLYEILTGKQPFAGATPIAAAVQRGRRLEAVSTLQPGLPRAWDEIVGKCLEYKPEDRYQSVAELQNDLESLFAEGKKSLRFGGAARRGAAKRSPLKLWLSVATVCLLLAGTGLAVLRFYPRTQPFASWSIEQPTDSGDVTHVAISPDGKTLAEVKTANGQHAVWIRNVSTEREVEILQPVGFEYGSMSFSQDGDTLYFSRKDKSSSFNLYRTSVLGGEPNLIARAIDPIFALSPDEKQFAHTDFSEGVGSVHIFTLATSRDAVLATDAGYEFSSPAWSPDGRSLAVERRRSDSTQGDQTIALFDLNSKKERQLSLPAGAHPEGALSWLPSGKDLLVLYTRNYAGIRAPGRQIGVLSTKTGAFRPLTNDMIPHDNLSLSRDGKIIATLLQQSGSEVSFFDSLGSALLSSTRIPDYTVNFAWLDENKLISQPDLNTISRDSGELGHFGVILPPTIHSIGMWTSADLDSAPTLCFNGELLLTGALNEEDQLFSVDSGGRFLTTVIKTKKRGGNMFCNRSNELVYYTEDDPHDPSIFSVPIAGGTPSKVMSLAHLASVVYASDGKFAAYIVNKQERSTATLINLEERKLVRDFPLANHLQGTLPHFTPDGKALGFVEQSKNGFAIGLQPVDGSGTRQLTGWFKYPITDFGWSPSGKILAIMSDRSTSDVALITDKSAKPSD